MRFFNTYLRKALFFVVLAFGIIGQANASCPDSLGYFYNVSADEFQFYAPTTGTNIHWDFGDSTTAAGSSVSHQYTSSGYYTVCLTFDNCPQLCETIYFSGNSSNDSTNLDSNNVPCPSILYYDAVVPIGSPVDFSHNAAFNGGNISSNWDFGDGNIVTSSSVWTSYQYSQAGVYRVCVTTPGCAQYCEYVSIVADTNSNDSIGGNISCPDSLGYWYNSTTDMIQFYAPITGTNVQWDFGDNSTGSGSYVNHQFPSAGYYTVCMTFDNCPQLCESVYYPGNGGVDSTGTDTNVVVNPGGGLDSNGTNPCDASIYVEADTNSGNTVFVMTMNSGLQYAWDFGDGNTSSIQFPSHTYSQAGNYQVCLTINDPVSGCTNTVCKSIQVSGVNLSIFMRSSGSGVTTGVSEHKELVQVNAYPNPFNANLSVSMEVETASMTEVKLFDALGSVRAIIVQERLDSGSHQFTFDASQMSTGVYYLSITIGNKVKVLPIIRE